MTEAGGLSIVSDSKVIRCFVHVCVGVNKTFYKTSANPQMNHRSHPRGFNQVSAQRNNKDPRSLKPSSLEGSVDSTVSLER